MQEQPRITESEWEIMKVLWSSQKRMTANEIITAFKDHSDWSPKTIRTLITRLVQKGAVGIDETGRIYTYYPLLQEEEGVRTEAQSFMKKVRGHMLKPLLAQFLSEQKLSEQDIAELKDLLDKRGP